MKAITGFLSVERADGLSVCKRKVARIKELNKSDEIVDIDDVNAENIYLVFMKLDWNEDFTEKIEKKRNMIQLNFVE